MMTEGELQDINKASGGVNHKGKTMLTEITNGSGYLGNKITRNSS